MRRLRCFSKDGPTTVPVYDHKSPRRSCPARFGKFIWRRQSPKSVSRLSELTASQQQRLARSLGTARWGQLAAARTAPDESEQQREWDRYRERLTGGGDPVAGRQIFRKSCAACHQLEGQGADLGPNLAAMQNRGDEAILLNVLDPNREVNPQYLAYTAITHEGRIVSGMIRNETATSLELVAADNRATTLLRAEIESLTSTRQSLMPTGLEQQIPPSSMADLIAYLRSIGPD